MGWGYLFADRLDTRCPQRQILQAHDACRRNGLQAKMAFRQIRYPSRLIQVAPLGFEDVDRFLLLKNIPVRRPQIIFHLPHFLFDGKEKQRRDGGNG